MSGEEMQVTPQDVKDLHEMTSDEGRHMPLLVWTGTEVAVCRNPTEENNGWRVLADAVDLASWLDGGDLTNDDAEQFAAELTKEIDMQDSM
jgi:hypothetical protein